MTRHETTSTAWPLVFSYNGIIMGRGFLAEIAMQGRLLATPEVEGVWLHGVNPGALAVGAATLSDANTELRNTLTRLFIDFAEQSATFDAFRERVITYFNESDAQSAQEWEEARKQVRAGVVPVPDGLPRKTAETDTKTSVQVNIKTAEAVTPQDNIFVQQDTKPVLAAAA
jgi:hypothetical protein